MKVQAVETRVSNTGSNSQNGFSVGLDWLTYKHTQILTGNEIEEIISSLESLADDQIDFCCNRPRYDNHKYWAGSGRSAKGLLLWYNPPHSSDELLLKSRDGNLISHPGLLPLPHEPVPSHMADYIREQLPEYAELRHDPGAGAAYDPVDGSKHQHHGYSIVAAQGADVERPGELRVSMSGKYLDHVDMAKLAAYLLIVRDVYGLRCSRVDMAIDDHEKRVPLSLVEKARRERNFFNVRSTSVVNSDDITKNIKGQSIYFGSRESEAFMRVYDKTAESEGERIGNRWESEFKGDKANACFSEWLNAMGDDERNANQLLVDLVLGTVDFRDRSKGDKNRKRCPLLPWFEEMCNMLSSMPIRLRIPRPKISLQRTVDYLKKSTAPSFASMSIALGEGFPKFLADLVENGKERMTNVRRKITYDADISKLCY